MKRSLFRFASCRPVAAKALAALGAVMFACGAGAGVGDKVLRFSSSGTDCYADGTKVRDGEWYALVWSPEGSAFAGFNADCSLVSSADSLVLAAPLAEGGRCRDALFQIPEAKAAVLTNGTFSVCLLDTRNARGQVAGGVNGHPFRVNRWGFAEVDASVGDAGSVDVATAKTASTYSTASVQAGACADTLSLLPASVKKPVIADMDLGGEDVVLEVKGTVPYLTYTIESGESPEQLADDTSATEVDGQYGSSIKVKAEAVGESRFYRIKRAER